MSDETHTPDRVTALWGRMKDHRVVQWTVGYVAVAYGIQHAVIVTSESLEWPNIIARSSIILLALGLPVAMTLAWYHGERAGRRVSGPEMTVIALLLVITSLLFYVFVRPSGTSVTGTASDIAVLIALLFAGLLLAVLFLRPPAEFLAPVPRPRPSTAAAIPQSTSTTQTSLAVLPLLNLSSDKEQEFFSDGMTEEITAALAQVRGLRVVGRTSAFQFKGTNKSLRSIGQALGADYLIEGSVRKAGNQLRITAQLIRAEDDSHLWAQNYDRELKDVFAVQEDIARAIATSLQAPLGLKQGETLVSGRTGNTESYEDYLRARALFRARKIREAITVLQRAVARDPDNAAAWALLAQSWLVAPAYSERVHDVTVEQARTVTAEVSEQAEKAARLAIRLNPKNALALLSLGEIEANHMRWKSADEFLRQAIALDPDDPDILHRSNLIDLMTGKLQRALETRNRLRALEPFVPIYNIYYAFTLLLTGRSDEGALTLVGVPNQGGIGAQRDLYLAIAHAGAGRCAEAADVMSSIPADQVLICRSVLKQAVTILRNPADPVATAQPTDVSRNPQACFVLAAKGAPVRALDGFEYVIATNNWTNAASWAIWTPVFAEARKSERFKQLLRKARLVDYWNECGWPDLCHPTTGDDFECS